jgi:hypothetical protein
MMSFFSSSFNLSANNTVEWKKRGLNLTPLDLLFKSTANRALKALYALIRHGDFLGTVEKYSCLNELTTPHFRLNLCLTGRFTFGETE